MHLKVADRSRMVPWSEVEAELERLVDRDAWRVQVAWIELNQVVIAGSRVDVVTIDWPGVVEGDEGVSYTEPGCSDEEGRFVGSGRFGSELETATS